MRWTTSRPTDNSIIIISVPGPVCFLTRSNCSPDHKHVCLSLWFGFWFIGYIWLVFCTTAHFPPLTHRWRCTKLSVHVFNPVCSFFFLFSAGFFFSVTARVWSFSSSSSPVAVRHTVSVAMEPALCSHGNGPGRLRPFSGSYLETLKRIVGCARMDGFFSRTNLYTELRHSNTNI